MQLINLSRKLDAHGGMRAVDFHRRDTHRFVIPRVRSGTVPGVVLMRRTGGALRKLSRDGQENPAKESTITIGSDRQVVGARSVV
jgi:hypothetical protein